MTAPVQRDEAWLLAASQAEIAAAHRAGELVALLTSAPAAPVDEPPVPGQYSASALGYMEPGHILSALKAGQLDQALGRPAAVTA